MPIRHVLSCVLLLGSVLTAAPAAAAPAGRLVSDDPARCREGAGSAVALTLTDVAESRGTIRVQTYRATAGEWLVKGRWVSRLEVPARAGVMRLCVPLPAAGSYAIAVRHDRNGNGRTDFASDGGGMSNNPAVNVLNLGRPDVSKVRFAAGNTPVAMTIRMRYLR
ncbi:DUF2141 domain-containing protein [Qipengyuania thermophila]|uniref:DUF2141 domain-containing protein n=1 Tax=Qipengyuania thermophila TaxID=2509361 RepID=UPI001F29AF0E|nr:DUF2141 domain-containing protein [Qipengyuania thermophila]